MPEALTEVASPGTPETETVTATRAAADAGDVSAFLDADRASRGGKPVEKIERPKPELVAKGAKPVEKGPSAKDREADERLVTRIREAVDTATASSRAEIDALKKQLAAGTAEPKVEAPPKGTPEHKRYLEMPDAPKLAEFESVEEHSAAMALFVGRKLHEERTAHEQRGARDFEQAQADIKRVETFHGRINAYKATDAAFATKLSPEVKAMHGFAKLQEINATRATTGQAPLRATVDHAISELIYDSSIPAQMAVHLSTHPADLAMLRAATTPQALSTAFGRLEGRVEGPPITAAAPAAAEPKPTPAEVAKRASAVIDRSVSHVPPPTPALGKAGTGVDPLKKAVETGDIGMFLDLDRQERAERRGLSR